MAVSEYIQSTFESVKKLWMDFDLKKWTESVGGTSAEAIEAAIYFGLSFSCGFVFKKYFKYIVVSLIVTLFAIKACEYAKLLTVDWSAVYMQLGMPPGSDLSALTNHWFDWIKDHLLLFIAAVIGFLVGYKLG